MLCLDVNPLIWGIVGGLGGGKTLSAVRFAVEGMIDGYFVVSNITLNLDAICREYGEHLRGLYKHVNLSTDDPFLFPCGDPRGSGGKRRVLVILDECAEYFDQYSSTKKEVIRFLSWLRHSSKRSQDVFFIIQSVTFLAKSNRVLVERWVTVTNMATYRLPGIRAKIPFTSHLCVRNIFDKNNERVDWPSVIVKKEWGKFYNTAECISVTGSGNSYIYERPVRGHGWPLWLWFYCFTLCLLLYV